MEDQKRKELISLLRPLLHTEMKDELDRARDNHWIELTLNAHDRFRLGIISVGAIRKINKLLGA